MHCSQQPLKPDTYDSSKSLYSHFLDDESHSTLELQGVDLGVAGADCYWPRDASDGNLGRD